MSAATAKLTSCHSIMQFLSKGPRFGFFWGLDKTHNVELESSHFFVVMFVVMDS